MNDDDLYALMSTDDDARSESDGLRDLILAETQSVLRGRRIRRRTMILGSLVMWTAATFIAGRLTAPNSSSPAPSSSGVSDIIDFPAATDIAQNGSPAETKDLRSLGDERAQRGDMAAALEFYRKYLDTADDDERKPRHDDSWLLASLKMELD